VWTGSEMIVWGGAGSGDLSIGGRYSPSGDSWTAMNAGPPAKRVGHTAVWTGREMIVWGGQNSTSLSLLNDGGRYNPEVDTWTPVTLTGAPSARQLHTAIWTGNEMIVWGGNGGNPLNDTFIYRPSLLLYLYQRP
jgi:N-acetylneuraminic acid mutarotase